MNQKRRRFEIRKKKKQREKLRKKSGGAKKAISTRIDIAQFKRADKFVGCEEALEVYFIPADAEVYRIVHNPIGKNDGLVQAEQVFDGIANTQSNLPLTIAPNSSVEDQFEHVSEWSLSFFLDVEKLEEDYWKWYDKRKTQESRDNYIKKRGNSIAKYILAPDFGLMQKTPDANSHLVAPEYVGIELDDYRDKTFFKPLTDNRHGKE